MARIIIDVREPHEYKSGHVEGAINIPSSSFMETKELADVPKDTEIIVYCRSGGRSNITKNILEQLGYTNIINGINKDRVEATYTT